MENLLNVLVQAQRVASDLGDHQISPAFISQASTPSLTCPDDIGELKTLEPEKPKNWKKPKDMPRRPLSAYNLFFKSERQRIVSAVTQNQPQKSRRKKSLGIGFAGMARSIAGKWKTIASADKSVFEEQAKIDKIRYRQEIAVWRSKQAAKKSPTAPKKKPAAAPAPRATESVQSSSSALILDNEFTSFDNSDATGQSLHMIMQDTLLRGRQQYNQVIDPVPFFSLSNARAVSDHSQGSSTYYPLDLTTSLGHHQTPRQEQYQHSYPQMRRRSSLIEPLYSEIDTGASSCYDSTVPASCWKALASTLSSDPFCFPSDSGDKVQQHQGNIDDLNQFMNNMEQDFW